MAERKNIRNVGIVIGVGALMGAGIVALAGKEGQEQVKEKLSQFWSKGRERFGDFITQVKSRPPKEQLSLAATRGKERFLQLVTPFSIGDEDLPSEHRVLQDEQALRAS